MKDAMIWEDEGRMASGPESYENSLSHYVLLMHSSLPGIQRERVRER